MLRSKSPRDYARPVVEASQLSYRSVVASLSEEGREKEMGQSLLSMKRNYHFLSALIRHAAGFELGGSTLERRMLIVDFRIMQWWCSVSRFYSLALCRTAFPDPSVRRIRGQLPDR